MKLILGEEHVVVRGIRPEEKLWGPYQFPLPYRLDDRILVSVHVEEDTIVTSGNPTRWFESFDEGNTWQETEPKNAAQCGLKLPNGDRLYFPVVGTQIFAFSFFLKYAILFIRLDSLEAYDAKAFYSAGHRRHHRQRNR